MLPARQEQQARRGSQPTCAAAAHEKQLQGAAAQPLYEDERAAGLEHAVHLCGITRRYRW